MFHKIKINFMNKIKFIKFDVLLQELEREKVCFTATKGPVQWENKTIVNVYAPNIIESNCEQIESNNL